MCETIGHHLSLTLRSPEKALCDACDTARYFKAVWACPGNNIALDASASRHLNSAQQSHSPRKRPKLEPSPSVSQQAPETLEGHTPSGSIHHAAHQAEKLRGDPSKPSDHHFHLKEEQQVSMTPLHITCRQCSGSL